MEVLLYLNTFRPLATPVSSLGTLFAEPTLVAQSCRQTQPWTGPDHLVHRETGTWNCPPAWPHVADILSVALNPYAGNPHVFLGSVLWQGKHLLIHQTAQVPRKAGAFGVSKWVRGKDTKVWIGNPKLPCVVGKAISPYNYWKMENHYWKNSKMRPCRRMLTHWQSTCKGILAAWIFLFSLYLLATLRWTTCSSVNPHHCSTTVDAS